MRFLIWCAVFVMICGIIYHDLKMFIISFIVFGILVVASLLIEGHQLFKEDKKQGVIKNEEKGNNVQYRSSEIL